MTDNNSEPVFTAVPSVVFVCKLRTGEEVLRVTYVPEPGEKAPPDRTFWDGSSIAYIRQDGAE